MTPPGTVGHFFFAAGEGFQRADLLRTHLPHEALDILHEADDICHHRFRIAGLRHSRLWRGDRLASRARPRKTGAARPLVPDSVPGLRGGWRSQDYVGVESPPASRHSRQGLAAQPQREATFARLIAQWRSWIKANPYPLGNQLGQFAGGGLPQSVMDMGRPAAGGRTRATASSTPNCYRNSRFTDATSSAILSTYFSPNTHLLGEAVALFFIGTLYPQIAAAARWQQTGWRIMLQEAQRQVRPDGVYFEQSLHYHVYALDFFLHARVLAARNGLAIPAEYDATLNACSMLCSRSRRLARRRDSATTMADVCSIRDAIAPST